MDRKMREEGKKKEEEEETEPKPASFSSSLRSNDRDRESSRGPTIVRACGSRFPAMEAVREKGKRKGYEKYRGLERLDRTKGIPCADETIHG